MGSVISKILDEEREYPPLFKPVNKESVIKWQTGVPPSSGSYLITVKGTFVTTDYWRCLEGRWVYWNGEVTAWCKLNDIKPYKEETK